MSEDYSDWVDNDEGVPFEKWENKQNPEKAKIMNDKEYVVVTTVSSFRHRFVMHKDDLKKLNEDYEPTDKDLIDWALDSVTMAECEEFSQEHLGEQIVDHFECDEDEMISFFDRDNEYLKEWTREYKVEWVRKLLNK